MHVMWPSGRLERSRNGEWEWSGGRIALVREEDIVAEVGLIIPQVPTKHWRPMLGPYRVRALRSQIEWCGIWVVEDSWQAPFWIALDRTGRTLNLLKITIIRAACIWQLGYKPEAERYCWRSIYVIDRIAQVFKRANPETSIRPAA